MKTPSRSFSSILSVLLLVGSISASANTKAKRSAPISSSSSVSAISEPSTSSSASTPLSMGFGFSSASALLSGLGVGSGESISVLFMLGSDQMVQANFVLPTTSPFLFSMSGSYKKTLVGDLKSGFHVGGGFGFGLTSLTRGSEVFFANFAGLGGLHFQIPSVDSLLFSFDGGPVFSVADGATKFAILPYSALLGLSVHYLF